jgi:dipeptidyl aminopeptidase/acylaminoacyl peptidase
LEVMLDDVDRRGIVDPKRVGITGLSSGATIVEQGLVYTQRFAAASSAYSNTGAINYYFLPAEMRDVQRKLHGAPFAPQNGWGRRSVGLNAARINVPYLIQVADREYLHTLQNYIDLKDAGKPVELFVYPDEYHEKWQPAHRYAVYRRNLQWMMFWLQDVEASDPVDPAQYERWRQLREQQRANVANRSTRRH